MKHFFLVILMVIVSCKSEESVKADIFRWCSSLKMNCTGSHCVRQGPEDWQCDIKTTNNQIYSLHCGPGGCSQRLP